MPENATTAPQEKVKVFLESMRVEPDTDRQKEIAMQGVERMSREELDVLRAEVDRKNNLPDVLRDQEFVNELMNKTRLRLDELRAKREQELLEQAKAKPEANVEGVMSSISEGVKKAGEGIGKGLDTVAQAAIDHPKTTAAVTLGVGLILAYSWFRSKRAVNAGREAAHVEAERGGGFFKKLMIGVGVGAGVFLGLKAWDMYQKGEKLGDLFDKGKDKFDDAAERAKKKAEEMKERAKDKFDDKDKEKAKESSDELMYGLTAPMILRLNGDEAEALEVDIFAKENHEMLAEMMTRMKEETLRALTQTPATEIVNKKFGNDASSPEKKSLYENRQKMMSFIQEVLKKNDGEIREQHGILRGNKSGKDLPQNADDMTLAQVCDLLGGKNLRLASEFIKNAPEILSSPLAHKKVIGEMMEKGYENMKDLGKSEFAKFLAKLPENERKDVRMEAIANCIEQKPLLIEIDTALGNNKELNDAERKMIKLITAEVMGAIPAAPDSLIHKACDGNEKVMKSLEPAWGKLRLDDATQIYLAMEKNEAFVLKIKLMHVLKMYGSSEDFSYAATELGFNTVKKGAADVASYVMENGDIPEDVKKYYRMIQREVLEFGGDTMGDLIGLAKSTPGIFIEAGLGITIVGRAGYSTLVNRVINISRMSVDDAVKAYNVTPEIAEKIIARAKAANVSKYEGTIAKITLKNMRVRISESVSALRDIAKLKGGSGAAGAAADIADVLNAAGNVADDAAKAGAEAADVAAGAANGADAAADTAKGADAAADAVRGADTAADAAKGADAATDAARGADAAGDAAKAGAEAAEGASTAGKAAEATRGAEAATEAANAARVADDIKDAIRVSNEAVEAARAGRAVETAVDMAKVNRLAEFLKVSRVAKGTAAAAIALDFFVYFALERPRILSQLENEKDPIRRQVLEDELATKGCGVAINTAGTIMLFTPLAPFGVLMIAGNLVTQETIGSINEGTFYMTQTEKEIRERGGAYAWHQMKRSEPGSGVTIGQSIALIGMSETKDIGNKLARQNAYRAYFHETAYMRIPPVTEACLTPSVRKYGTPEDKKRAIETLENDELSYFKNDIEKYISKATAGTFVAVDIDTLKRAEMYATVQANDRRRIRLIFVSHLTAHTDEETYNDYEKIEAEQEKAQEIANRETFAEKDWNEKMKEVEVAVKEDEKEKVASLVALSQLPEMMKTTGAMILLTLVEHELVQKGAEIMRTDFSNWSSVFKGNWESEEAMQSMARSVIATRIADVIDTMQKESPLKEADVYKCLSKLQYALQENPNEIALDVMRSSDAIERHAKHGQDPNLLSVFGMMRYLKAGPQ